MGQSQSDSRDDLFIGGITLVPADSLPLSWFVPLRN